MWESFLICIQKSVQRRPSKVIPELKKSNYDKRLDALKGERSYIKQCPSEIEEASSKEDLHRLHKIINSICDSSYSQK
ncbi:hypothetical protein BpHYR1_012491 [Brachionus plicatilis]|uniref:Uncharacterized protein n=1 Tax=Brachionus plicatilis TaxID=10195 RepID=A0A3M7SW23_BRAPC|nr:hypothetical protein BpHYR1_012491 [Brachionus plicatilis]